MTFQKYLLLQSWSVSSWELLTPMSFDKNEIAGLVLDFDGVLAHADALEIHANIEPILKELLARNIKIAIHSNNRGSIAHQRKRYIESVWREIVWMNPIPLKPSPLTIETLAHMWDLRTQQIAMIDDRLCTGGFAAYAAQSRFIYFSHPLIDKNFFAYKELGMRFVRKVEKIIYQPPRRQWCAQEDSNL